jgi:GNAT superfamily N-acetyltransferase
MVTGQTVCATGSARELTVRRASASDRGILLEYLRRDPRGNLVLIDLSRRLGAPAPPGEEAPELLVAWRARELCGVGAIRPSVAFDSALGEDELSAFSPYVARLSAGLLKGRAELAKIVWAELAARGSQALLDRMETSCVVTCESFTPAAPYVGDPQGFRRWVRGRIPRARVVESGGRIRFVGYADVRCSEGWLLQGVYTWRDQRRCGFAKAGISDLCEAAFRDGANHVQLSVVDGNLPARGLYEGLGFRPETRLRTILFT